MDTSFKQALWFGGVKKDMPIRIYVHGEYKGRDGQDWLSANKGDQPSPYTFGVKRKDIMWIES